MAKKKRVMYSSEMVHRAIAYAVDNSRQRAKKNADDYIRLNPQDGERRRRDLAIEQVGIDNIYYEVLRQLEELPKALI